MNFGGIQRYGALSELSIILVHMEMKKLIFFLLCVQKPDHNVSHRTCVDLLQPLCRQAFVYSVD